MLRIHLALALLMGSMSTWAAHEAKAQHFSFDFGHHGGHYDDYHHGWYNHWAPPPHVVYVNPPAPRTVYVVPQNTANRYNAQVGAAAANRALPATAVASPRKNSTQPAGRVTLRNTSGKGVPVAFLVDGKDIELDDGASQHFTATGTRIVEFDRGDEFGSARYELTPGSYQFSIAERGWQLLRENSASLQTTAAAGVRKNSLPPERR
jgi:hypothetical protein